MSSCNISVFFFFFFFFGGGADSVTNKNFPVLFFDFSGTSSGDAIFFTHAALLRMRAGLAYLISESKFVSVFGANSGPRE